MADKKRYSAPKLIVYGDVRKLTRSAAKNIQKDGGPNNIKT
jgi:hypothetical protein